MKKIGLTGGIGSGKTYICEQFKQLGIPVFNSDEAARQLEKHPEVQKGFKELLGDDIFVNGQLDRVKMRSIVFTDGEKLKKVNELVIPYIKQMFEQFCELNSGFPYCILESAIIYETNTESHFDKIITVSADMHTRLNRTMKRDGSSEEEVYNKFRVQSTDIQKEVRADFIMSNDGHQDIKTQVAKIHKKLIEELGFNRQPELKKIEYKEYPEIGRRYRHYKGGLYEVMSMAKHSETKEDMVVYKSIHFGSVHVRPLSMWFDKIEGLEKNRCGTTVFRFRPTT